MPESLTILSPEREPMLVKIFLADDHEVVREGVKSLLRMRQDWTICGEAANGPDTVEGVTASAPDALVLDLSMPGLNGLEVAKRILAISKDTKILVFTMHDSAVLAREVKKAGARGLVHKSLAGRDLIRALEVILEGGTFFESGEGPEHKHETKTGSQLLLLREWKEQVAKYTNWHRGIYGLLASLLKEAVQDTETTVLTA
jgi:DNA-binding NarL/FixJ family response regulator